MSRQLTRVLAVVMAGTALSGAAAAGAGLPAMAAPAVQAARASTAGLSRAAVPGAQLWARRYNGPVNGANKASSVAVSPDGKMVFVTGRSQGHGYAYAAATVAYRAATGTRLWTSRDISPGSAAAIALSPRGGTVFMAGNTEGRARKRHYATIAYRAATGTPLWTRRYRTDAFALALAVSPGGGTVFVTGTADVTVAYRAATGRELWASPPGGDALGEAIAVSPDGKAVFVTGRDIPAASYATVAYDAATGARLWARKYSGSGSDIVGDAAKSVAVSPDGRTVFVTGRSTGATTDQDYATIAYNAATGTQRWVSRYNGPGNGPDAAWMMALSPDGRTVFVSGSSTGATAGSGDYATLAYDAATGTQRWVSRYDNPGRGLAQGYAVAVSANGRKVYVTGASHDYLSTSDYATVAYDAATGAQLWASRYNGPASQFDAAHSVAVSPGGGRVFVTGASMGVNKKGIFHLDYATVAYRG